MSASFTVFRTLRSTLLLPLALRADAEDDQSFTSGSGLDADTVAVFFSDFP